MNSFKRIILIVAIVTQAVPFTVANNTKPEAVEKKKVSPIAKVAAYTGATVFGAMALASVLASAYLGIVASATFKNNNSKDVAAFFLALTVAGSALGIGCGKLARLCYKKANQKPVEEKQS